MDLKGKTAEGEEEERDAGLRKTGRGAGSDRVIKR